jgi:hypothetical protein
MNLRITAAIAAACLLAGTAAGALPDRYHPSEMHVGGLVGAMAAARDTTYLLGGPGRLDGRFETIGGQPAWQGWTHADANDSVGDFTQLWDHLIDIDPCATNQSPQVAFIDDGVVVPGTGGTTCVTWCYGPGGYVVNNSGGIAGPEHYLDNLVLSPPLVWPAGDDGAQLAFDLYHHDDFHLLGAGIAASWQVRSVNTGDPADLADAEWRSRGLLVLDTGYHRIEEDVTGLLTPGRTHVQVALRCVELGWLWGWVGTDGTPAPYFDNVAFKAFPFAGPAQSAREIDLAQDNFPARGDLDLVNLANNAIRFDMAHSIAPAFHLRNDPGDSILVDVRPVRAGGTLVERPRMVVTMKANPLFAGVRALPPNFIQDGDLIEGWVYGDSTFLSNGTPLRNRFSFDLPDSGFFFPGDVIHYYIEARDVAGGVEGVSRLPSDISRVADFDGALPYHDAFTVRGLPTLLSLGGAQPRVLFWDDAKAGATDDPADHLTVRHWYHALASLGFRAGLEVDIYATRGPLAGVGNGLGGRATSSLLDGYSTLLYTAGDLGEHLLGNNDTYDDPSNDLGVLSNWFQLGGKHALFAGDDLVRYLSASGDAALAFQTQYLAVNLVRDDLRPYINHQTAPTVRPIAGSGVFTTAAAWIAAGGCPRYRDFDAITPMVGAVRIAQYLSPSGLPDAYTYAAATRRIGVADVIVLPYDLATIQSPPDYVPQLPGVPLRAVVLRDILVAFGNLGGSPVDVPDASTLAVSAFPNPFNPRTTISLDLPRAAEVALRLYDIRGRQVRTLHEGRLEPGRQTRIWDGTDDEGRQVAAGIYFYEARVGEEVRIGKLALVR